MRWRAQTWHERRADQRALHGWLARAERMFAQVERELAESRAFRARVAARWGISP